MGNFVILEGANGAGKTTLVNYLKTNGYKTLSSPNGTDLAKMIRPACRGVDQWKSLDSRVKFLLFSAARMDEYLALVHNSQELVVADRWWTSTYVYQCIYEGIPVSCLESTIHPEEKVNRVVLLDGDENMLVNRVRQERQKNTAHGVCQWTQTDQSIIDLILIYRNVLPPYLKSRGIDVRVIDTTKLTTEEVAQEFIKNIGDLQ